MKSKPLEILYLPTAVNDLKQIRDWYEVKFSKETSRKVLDSIRSTIDRLAEHPRSGSLTPDEYMNLQGYRMVVCEKQIAIYRVIDKAVYIYHVADTRSDYSKLFYYPNCLHETESEYNPSK